MFDSQTTPGPTPGDVKSSLIRHGDRLDYAVFVTLFVVFSLHWFTGFKTLPWDAMDEFYPMSRFTVDTIRAGHWPWWNPFQYAGTPWFADPQSLIFTLFTPIGVALGSAYTPGVFGSLLLLHLLAGGVAIIGYARATGCPLLQRVVAAIVYAMAGVATSRLQHVPQIVTYAYLPVILYFAHGWLQRPTLARWLCLTAMLALFAANPNQLSLLGALALSAIIMVHWATQPAGRLVKLAGLAAAAAIALLAASPLLAAVAEFAALSARTGLSLGDSAPSSFPAFLLTALGFPGVVGIGGMDKLLWPPNDLTESWLYLGVGPILLLLLAAGKADRRMQMALLALLAAFAMYSLGINASLYPWLYANVPGFNLFRRPADGAYVVVFVAALLLTLSRSPMQALPARRVVATALALAAALLATSYVLGGYDFARARAQAHAYLVNGALMALRFLIMAMVIVLLQRRYTANWSERAAAIWIVALCIVVDVTSPVRYREYVGVSRSSAPVQIYRNHLRTDEAREVRQMVDWLAANGAGGNRATVRFEAAHAPLGRAMPSAVAIASTLGYSPMRLASYHQIIGAPEPWLPRVLTRFAPHYDSAWFKAIGLRYVLLSAHHLDTGDSGDGLANLAKSLRENLVRSGAQRVLRRANDELWQLPEGSPVVSLVDASALAGREPATHDPTRGQCALLDRTAESIAVQCEVKVASTAVFSEVWYPGWYACVDGNSQRVDSAWGLLRAIPLPVGQRRVTMHFEPVPFWRNARCAG